MQLSKFSLVKLTTLPSGLKVACFGMSSRTSARDFADAMATCQSAKISSTTFSARLFFCAGSTLRLHGTTTYLPRSVLCSKLVRNWDKSFKLLLGIFFLEFLHLLYLTLAVGKQEGYLSPYHFLSSVFLCFPLNKCSCQNHCELLPTTTCARWCGATIGKCMASRWPASGRSSNHTVTSFSRLTSSGEVSSGEVRVKFILKFTSTILCLLFLLPKVRSGSNQ